MTTIDRIIIDWFNTGFGNLLPENFFWVGNIFLILLSLVMTALLSGLIGFEREYNGHAAGLRTHLMVAIGSALIMIISIYGFSDAAFSAGRWACGPGFAISRRTGLIASHGR